METSWQVVAEQVMVTASWAEQGVAAEVLVGLTIGACLAEQRVEPTQYKLSTVVMGQRALAEVLLPQ